MAQFLFTFILLLLNFLEIILSTQWNWSERRRKTNNRMGRSIFFTIMYRMLYFRRFTISICWNLHFHCCDQSDWGELWCSLASPLICYAETDARWKVPIDHIISPLSEILLLSFGFGDERRLKWLLHLTNWSCALVSSSNFNKTKILDLIYW